MILIIRKWGNLFVIFTGLVLWLRRCLLKLCTITILSVSICFILHDKPVLYEHNALYTWNLITPRISAPLLQFTLFVSSKFDFNWYKNNKTSCYYAVASVTTISLPEKSEIVCTKQLQTTRHFSLTVIFSLRQISTRLYKNLPSVINQSSFGDIRRTTCFIIHYVT